MSFHLARPARRELVRAIVWYNQQQEGLGDQFLEAVRQAFQRVTDHPETHPKEVSVRWRREIRRCPVVGFPYQVIFDNRPQEVFVLAVAHNARRPGYWARHR